MEEDQIYEEIVVEENPQLSQQGAPTQAGTPAGNTGQTNQQAQQLQQAQAGNTEQAAGIETDDNVIEEAEKHGQPSNTITEWQRVHDKGYVERITEKTEKH